MKKKNYFSLARSFAALLFIMAVFSVNLLAQSWTIYDSSVLPNAATPVFSASSGTFSAAENMVIDDPEITGNTLLWMEVPGKTGGPETQTQFYWRMNFASLGIDVTNLTVVMRVKGHVGRDMAMDLDMHYNDIRSRVTLHTETNLARIRNGSGTDAPLDVDLTEWNIYRFVMSATETKLFVNEDPDPVMVFTPASATSSNKHFRFGDGDSGNDFGADIDWIIWDVTGDYAPGEGLPIPAELLPGDPEPSNWTVYDASVLPNAFVPVFSTASGSFNETENQIIIDPDIPGNKLLWMDVNGNPQTAFLWRQNFASHDVTVEDLTLVMRVKGHPNRDMALDLDVHYNDIRSRVTFHSVYNEENNFVRIRNGSGTNASLPVDVQEWNIYRFAMNANETRIFVNEDPTPVMVFTPAAAASANRHFRFGDGDSGASYGADTDWIIWDVTGSFAPGEGSPLPDFSYTPSSDASLAELHADGEPIEGFDPAMLNYELVLPTGTTEIPVISAVSTDPGATVEITQANAIPGTAIVEVTAENGFTTRTYSIDIRLVSTDATLEEILVDGETLDDFDANVLVYTVYLPTETTTEIPVVSATASDENALVAITQATEIEGTATIVVTAEDEVTTLTYTLNFVLVSVDATLSDLMVDGTTIEGFDPEVIEYTYLLAIGITDVPVVTATANNENATVDITQATAIPGTASVQVTAEDGVTELTYSVHFLTGSSDATLSDLLVNGVTVEGFDPEVTAYDVALPSGTTEVPVVTAFANHENAEVVITPATEIPGTTSVMVTAEDQFTQLEYLVHFRIVSSDASLQALHLDGQPWPAFEPGVLSYDIHIPESSLLVPVVAAIAASQGATVEVTQADQIPGTALIVVTAEDGLSTTTYEVNFLEGGYDWRYYDASVLPNEHVPTFSPSNVGGSGGTNVIATDPDDETNSFLELITAVNGDNYMWSTPFQPETPAVTLVMKVKAANDQARRVIELDVQHNGIRERLYINREMNRVRLNEGIGGGDGGEIEAPEGVNLSDWNIYRLTKEGNSTKLYLNENPEPIAVGTTITTATQQYFRFGDGNSSHNTAALLDWFVWDETGAYAPGEGLYIPAKVVTPDWDASLSELLADGVLIDGFAPQVIDYEFVYTEEPADIPVISAVLSNPEATLVVTQADEFPGVATAEVTAINGFTVWTYTVTFRYISSDATLSDILVNNVSLTGFDPDVPDYDVVLPAGTTAVPVVAAVANDANAEVDITQATEVTGTATILVTAEDGSEVTYTINFSLDDTSVPSIEVPGFRVYPNPANSNITIDWGGNASEAYVEIINLTGQVLFSNWLESHSETISVSNLQQGTYIIRITAGQNRSSRLFMKQ